LTEGFFSASTMLGNLTVAIPPPVLPVSKTCAA
jgi:hypothetical protein